MFDNAELSEDDERVIPTAESAMFALEASWIPVKLGGGWKDAQARTRGGEREIDIGTRRVRLEKYRVADRSEQRRMG